MISPSASSSLVYPYTLYTMQGGAPVPQLHQTAQMLPNMGIGSQPAAIPSSNNNLIDPNFAGLNGLNGINGLNGLNAYNLINNNVVGLPMGGAYAAKQLVKKINTTGKIRDRFSPYLTSKLTHDQLKNHFHIFVGDLSSDLTIQQLRDAFAAFGEVSDAKIIKDNQTGKSKGYGFVSFVNKEEAQKAINEMNGQWIGSRAVRTNWAVRKPPQPIEKPTQKLDYEEVFNQSSSTNYTVYIGGIQQNLNEELMREAFKTFGSIQEVRLFQDKGFAFIRFDNKESACKAIIDVNGTEVGGFTVRCSWGKESNDNDTASPNYSQQLLSHVSAYYALNALNHLNTPTLQPQPQIQTLNPEQLAYTNTFQPAAMNSAFPPYGAF